jgi:hypothetical protein
MTKSTKLRADLLVRLPALVARLVLPLAGAAAVLVVVGLVAVLTDHYGLALAAVLLIQAGVVVMGLAHHLATAGLEDRLAHRIDQASARQLADLARTRHALLSAGDDPADRR